MNSPDEAATQLRNDLASTIRRYASESDVSVCEALGVLRMVENDLIMLINASTEKLEDADD